MIRLGVCTKPENAALLAQQGFEYIEVGLAWLHGLTKEDYQKELAIAKAAPIRVEAANGMLPGEVKVTGPEANDDTIRAYLEKAFCRAHEMGIKIVVFGSSGVRQSSPSSSVDALCSSADTAGGSNPIAPSAISPPLKPITNR